MASTGIPQTITSPESSYLPLETFLKEYTDISDGYKYEWNDGQVEKTPAMNQEQIYIQAVLQRIFFNTKACKDGALFTAETDMYTSEKQLRRPDLAIYTSEQLEKMRNGDYQVAPWVAEIISQHDNFNHVLSKVQEYFIAGVSVAWIIVPASRQVYVYTAAEKVQICSGENICSSAPVFPDFEIAAKALFE